MSYKETVEILGANGRKESVRENLNSYSVTYLFSERGFKGIEITASFLNDGLSQKSFYSMAPTKSAVTITAQQFDEVKSSMSYEDIKHILNGEGILIADYGFLDSDFHSHQRRNSHLTTVK